jgi:hypothetical protein
MVENRHDKDDSSRETGGENDNVDGCTNLNNDPEDGEAVGCRGVAKPRTQLNDNNAAMLDVADGPSKSPPILITNRMAIQ